MLTISSGTKTVGQTPAIIVQPTVNNLSWGKKNAIREDCGLTQFPASIHILITIINDNTPSSPGLVTIHKTMNPNLRNISPGQDCAQWVLGQLTHFSVQSSLGEQNQFHRVSIGQRDNCEVSEGSARLSSCFNNNFGAFPLPLTKPDPTRPDWG